MSFLAVGVDHKSTPLATRERVAMDAFEVERASKLLTSDGTIDELAILSTCNRTELYIFASEPDRAYADAAQYLLDAEPDLANFLTRREEMEVAEHLFRVASGLESQALGEAQILGQVRETLETGQRLGTIGPNLHSLFRSAISCARQARAGTALGRLNVSLGSAAVEMARDEIKTLAGKQVLLIGGGEVIRLAAQDLIAAGAGNIFIANRTESVASELAERFNAHALPLANVDTVTPTADLIICATSAAGYILGPESMPVDVLAAREKPLQIFDLAIPRDVDPRVGALPGVTLHDLDTLLPSAVRETWSEDVRQMETIIASRLVDFRSWYLTRRVAPVIASLRSHVEAVSRQELQRVAPQLKGLDDRERAAVESLTNRLIDKMFHHLVTRLRLAAQVDPSLVEAAEFFFLHGDGGLFDHAADNSSPVSEGAELPALEDC